MRTFVIALLFLSTAVAQSNNSQLHIEGELPLPALQTYSMSYRTVPGLDVFYVQTEPNKYLAIDTEGHSYQALNTLAVPGTTNRSSLNLSVIDLSPVPSHGVIAPVIWQQAPPFGSASSTAPTSHIGILAFDQHGQYKELIELKEHSNPARIAEFSDAGGYIFLGYDDSGALQLQLLDSAGTVVKTNLLPPLIKKDSKPSDATSPKLEDLLDQAAMAAAKIQLVSGDDGCIYAYSPDWGAKILRFQPSGQSSEIVLKSSLPTITSLFPLAMFVSHKNIFIDQSSLESGGGTQAAELNRFTLDIYNGFSGELSKSYTIEESYGASPVMLDSTGLYFLNAKVNAGHLTFSLVHASL
jgi:hypothetical protein